MSNDVGSLLRANFAPAKQVTADVETPDPTAEFLKKAKESISGSMVFTERQTLYWNGDDTK